MPRAEQDADHHLTEYERAVCYYTLPRVVRPVTFGLVVAYTVCLVEAVAALLIGLLVESRVWTLAGAFATAAIVLFGLIVFMVRALINEMRQRSALAEARGVPDVLEDNEDFPDPFAGHLLLARPNGARGHLYACTENDSTIRYFVSTGEHGRRWHIRDPQDNEVCTAARARRWTDVGFRTRIRVYRGEQLLGRIVREPGLNGPHAHVYDLAGETPREYVVRDNGIFFEGNLAGRIYALRGACYLDIEQAHFNRALLAHFVSHT
mgnify:CR=1 FL=1